MTDIRTLIDSGTITIVAWDDPLAADGFDADTDDTLTYLTPILGPSAVVVLHRIARYLNSGATVWVCDLHQLAATFGLGYHPDTTSQLTRTLMRLEQFGMIREHAGTVEVRTRIPKLPRRWLNRMPGYLADHCPYTA